MTAKLISGFVFAIRIVQSLFFLNPKFQASNLPLWLYSLVCVGPGRKPEDRFSYIAAQIIQASLTLNILGLEAGVIKLSRQEKTKMLISGRAADPQYEPRHEKTYLRGFRQGPTQTGLYDHKRRLEV